MQNPRLVDDEICGIQPLWKDMSGISYFESYRGRKRFLPYFDLLSSHRVIEIGPGVHPVNEYYLCGEYIDAAPPYPNDGLSVLRRQPDASAVVVSFGVIDGTILAASFETMSPEKTRLLERYITELAEEIKRVMNPFAIVVGLDAERYLGKPHVYCSDGSPHGGVYIPNR